MLDIRSSLNFAGFSRKPVVTVGIPSANLDEREKPRVAGLDRVSKAMEDHQRTDRPPLEKGDGHCCHDQPEAFCYLMHTLSRMKLAPRVHDLNDASGILWPFNIARKDGTIYVHFVDPDGDGEYLIPFDDAEIVDLD